MLRDVLEYDVLIVGGGPAGLATAIRLKQLDKNLTIALFEKGSSIGANIVSGCILDPSGLNELIPNWRQLNFPVTTQVSSEQLLFLTKNNKIKLPIPGKWKNNNNFVISLNLLCKKLASFAEHLGVEIYCGYSAKMPIIENNTLCGIITGDVGLDKNNIATANYAAGMEIRAKQTVIAEGARGSLAKLVIQEFNLNKDSMPQTYGLGIKEIWQIDSKLAKTGSITHCIGYPLNNKAYGGGFLYHMENNLVAVGLVTALDYTNPYLSPYAEFQKFKLHPVVSSVLQGGTRLEYGARVVVEGGIQSLPKVNFNGGVIVGDSAGFLNVAKIKGVDNAIKSGMIAATAIADALKLQQLEAQNYSALLKRSKLYHDLYAVRNIRPAFNRKLICGLIYSAIDYYILRGKAPWTFKNKIADNNKTQLASKVKPIKYAKADNKLTFDIASSIYLSNISHNDNQPCHLKLKDATLPITYNLAKYAALETKYCPAGVYEIIQAKNAKPYLQIHAQNCIHCKACDIKDPNLNINWEPPESGSGPQYTIL
ncbi:MAG: electron transfer flavoprotein-ubiquinone oxidoreductase [Burkholderiales bacterium]|nr:electron transfer flavoprotein-ubiquinone oxidoreductase [Burkholderiales bacterium]